MASDMVRAGSATHVLVVGVERLTDILDLTDRGTAFIFADGAGAAVVGPSDTPGIGPVVWGSDGESADVIWSDDWNEAFASGKKPVVTYAIDPEILGGLILTVGDLRLDNSVRRHLAVVREQMRTRAERGLEVGVSEE